jgi:hypothetical protein
VETSPLLSDHAATIATAYGFGSPVREMIMAARGEQGRIWRLDTDMGALAIKELIIGQTRTDAAADVAYQEAVLATGAVPMPRPVRTVAGEVLVDLDGHQVRAYEWVDLLAMDRTLDPAIIGAMLAAVHRVHYAPARPLIGWYTDPVGARRWGQLLNDAKAVAAPFCRGARSRDSRAASTGSVARTAENTAELPSRPVGGQHSADTERRDLCDRLGELWTR